MNRKFAAALSLAALTSVAALGVAAPANATAKGSGCPEGYQIEPVSYVLSQATPGFEGAIAAADANHDGQLCYKLLPDAIPLFQPTFLYEDNTVPTP